MSCLYRVFGCCATLTDKADCQTGPRIDGPNFSSCSLFALGAMIGAMAVCRELGA